MIPPVATTAPHPRHHVKSGTKRRWIVGTLVAIALIGAGVTMAMLNGLLPNGVVAGDPNASGHEPTTPRQPVSVRVVHPKRDPSVQVTMEQLATVEAYFRADLRARASGLVKLVTKDIGDRVRQGDLLVVIDVPEYAQEISQKEAGVAQRLQEVRVARAQFRDADAKRDVAKTIVRQRQAEVGAAEATAEFRRKRLDRFKILASRQTIGPDVLEEQEKEVKAGDAAVLAAQVAVERAQADLREADARIEAAQADIELKSAIVEVARRDLERAFAIADYARVTAPFDGVIVRRTVDPGSFVQNATTGQSEALISVARTDMVTIAARFPDAAAPFVNPDTEAEIVMNSLPGVTLRGPVTRFAPSVQNNDRTMRVEMDVFTGSESEYRALMSRIVSANLSPLGGGCLWGVLASRIGSARALAGMHKGDSDLLAARTAGSTAGRLLPGMSANMKLFLKRFSGGFVVPSNAIYSRSGKPYVLLVENGKTKQYPVQVQLNDQRIAKILIEKSVVDSAGSHEVATELTGQEEIVVAKQLEIGDGQSVRAAISQW